MRPDRGRSVGCGRPNHGRSYVGKVFMAGRWRPLVGSGSLGAVACYWQAVAILAIPVSAVGWPRPAAA